MNSQKDMNNQKKELTIDDVAVFCKKKGFVFRSSDIYGGFSGFWDFGHLGVELFDNLKADFWSYFVRQKDNMIGIKSSIISHPRTWKASGHLENFNDISIKCRKCGKISKIDKTEIDNAKCSFCSGELDKKSAKSLNLMFKTPVGPVEEDSITSYLRPETAQGMFMNFRLAQETSRKQLPFGIAQIGKCFRNEIAPRDFLFRSREFHIGEFEFFIHPNEKKCNLLTKMHLKLKIALLDAKTQEKGKSNLTETTIGKMLKEKKLDEWHAYWLAEQIFWLGLLGLNIDRIKVREHMKTELSHYSSATFDIDYEFPFGSKEIAGIADRGQYDLSQHAKESGENLYFFDEISKQKVIPRVIEPTFGIERIFLALIVDAYDYDKQRGNIILHISPKLAPYKAAVFPLISKGEILGIAKEIYEDLLSEFNVLFDDSGSIGRRYARNDETGTPYCITVDEQTSKDKAVTIRDRDTTRQIRVPVKELKETLRKLVNDDANFENAGKTVNTRVK